MTTRKPTAFRLDAEDVTVLRAGETPTGAARVIVEPVEETDEALADTLMPPSTRGFGWGKLFLGALSGLIALAVGLWINDLVAALFARNDWLGYLALAIVALGGVALLALAVRETAGLFWVARIDRLRHQAETIAKTDDGAGASDLVERLSGLYARRRELAPARAVLASHADEVIDGRDRLILAEATLMAPLDEAASRLVSETARRVSVVTAISPRAAIDLLYVFFATLRLVRQVATLYGGRPGLLGLARLTRLVITHLAVTGSIAIGDGLAQQLVGHGLAAKLSARLGEGVVNGMLTARVGLAAIDVCRPLPYFERKRPGVTEVMGSLLSSGAK